MTMTKKYKLTDEVKEVSGITLYRIEALINFSDVKAGDKGGYIQKENNLSQEQDAWVYEEARVSGEARVYEEARVSGEAWVSGDAWVSGEARVDQCNKYITISPVGSEDSVLTAFKQKDDSIWVNRGCFSGSIDQFEAAVKETHGENIHGEVYLLAIELIKKRLLG